MHAAHLLLCHALATADAALATATATADAALATATTLATALATATAARCIQLLPLTAAAAHANGLHTCNPCHKWDHMLASPPLGQACKW